MKSIVILLIFTGCLGVNGFYYKHELEQSFGENDELLGVVSARNNDLLQPRFFNFSLDGIFNNSLLTLAGIFVVGVILFGNYYWTANILKVGAQIPFFLRTSFHNQCMYLQLNLVIVDLIIVKFLNIVNRASAIDSNRGVQIFKY